MSELAERLAGEFEDEGYAHAYMESHAITRIAAQVFALRKQRDWTQQELADKSGIAQVRISKIENADFTSLTLSTLHKLARAFDIDLRVGFEPFSKGILDVVNLSPKALEVLPRPADLESFKGLRLKTNTDGNWALINTEHLAVVHTLPPPAPASTVRVGQWTALGKR